MTVVRWVLGFVIAFAIACGGNTPVAPTPVPPSPDPGPVVPNAAPVIGAFRVQGLRASQPAAFADLAEEIDVSVTVTDEETSVANLRFNWSSTSGAFTGTGANVKWRAPAAGSTPAAVTLNVEVVETYTSQGRQVENRVTGSTTLRLHDSVREVSELARQFLLDFSDSKLDVSQVMRHFQPGCRGTDAETADVARNRDEFEILDWKIGDAATTVNFAGRCRFRNIPGDACSRVPVYWFSRARRDIYNTAGELELREGQTASAEGIDQVAAVYDTAERRWRLCDSQFDSGATTLARPVIRGLVP